MGSDLLPSVEEAISRPIKDFLKELCCEPLTFMWNNSLLSPRISFTSTDEVENHEGQELHMRYILGFRVRRNFFFMRRDQTLFECPFCRRELVIPLGFWTFERWFMVFPTRLAKGLSQFKMSNSQFERFLNDTKRACAGVWPPRERD